MSILKTIPLSAVDSQKVSCDLSGQYITIKLITRQGNLFADITADGEVIAQNRLCLHGVPLVDNGYSPINGDFVFLDMQGEEADPVGSGLGGRFVLMWGGSDG